MSHYERDYEGSRSRSRSRRRERHRRYSSDSYDSRRPSPIRRHKRSKSVRAAARAGLAALGIGEAAGPSDDRDRRHRGLDEESRGHRSYRRGGGGRERRRYEDDDDAEPRRRPMRQETDDTVEVIRRWDGERVKYGTEPTYRSEEDEDNYSPSPPHASGGTYYPSTSQFPPPPAANEPPIPPYNAADYVNEPANPYNSEDYQRRERAREREYYGDEEEIEIPRRRYNADNESVPRRRRDRQETEDYSNMAIDAELGMVVRERETEQIPRSYPIPPTRPYRAQYFDDVYESEGYGTGRSRSPAIRYRRRFDRSRDSISSFSSSSRSSSPPIRRRWRYREVSPSILSGYRQRHRDSSPIEAWRDRITEVERRFEERSRPSSLYSKRSEQVEKENGSTRFPTRYVNKRAIIDMGYPFEEEGDVIVIPKILSHKSIFALLKLSEEYGFDRRLQFESPFDMDGNPLDFPVNLVAQASSEKDTSWNNTTLGSATQPWEILSLNEPRAYTDDDGVEKINLTVESVGGSTPSSKLRWIHMKQDYMSLESLERLVRQILEPNSDDLLIAVHLLRRVTEKAEKSYIHGRYLKPIVLRGNSRSVGNQTHTQPDRHCTFINFPYFSHQTPYSPPQQKQSNLHTAPGLLQTMYLLESTKLRDEKQAICKIRPDKRGKTSIHVPQLWSITIDVLITYSTHSLPNLRGESIEVQKSISKKQSGPSVLRITDPYQRMFFFPLEKCKTWFELEELVYTQCELGARRYIKRTFDIVLKGGETITGAEWPTVIASEDSPFIDISVRFKPFHSDDSEEPSSEDDNYRTRVPQPVVIQRRTTTYHSPRRESTRVLRSRYVGNHHNAIRARDTRGSTKDSRRWTQRSRRSHSGLRTGVETTAVALSETAAAGLYQNGKTKEGRAELQEASATREIGRAATVRPTVGNKIDVPNPTSLIPGMAYDRAREQGGHTANNQSAETDSSDRGPINAPNTLNTLETVPHISVKNHSTLDSSNAMSFIQEAEEGLVAEPESYAPIIQPAQHQSSTRARGNSMALVRYERRRDSERRARPSLPTLERRRSSYVRGDSMALVPFREKQDSIQREDPVRHRDRTRSYHFVTRTAPRPSRAILESKHEDSRVRPRRLPEPRRRGLLVDNHRESQPERRQTLNVPQKYEEKRPIAAFSRRNTNEDRRMPIRSIGRPSRQIRGRPAINGIVVNATFDDDLEPGIYYVPKKMEESIPAARTNGNTRDPSAGVGSNSQRLNSNDSMSKRNPSIRSFQDSAKGAHRERRSGSFNLPATQPIESSVLPILMWPTGPPPNLDSAKNSDKHSNGLSDEKLDGSQGPPRTPKPTDAVQTSSNDQSMQEVLERIYNSLLTDGSNHHDKLFMEMETAQVRDATYALPEQPATANQEDSGPLKGETVAGKSKYDPAEGFLRTGPQAVPDTAHVATPEYQTKLFQFSSTANELLEFFIPADYSHAVTGRYYGSVKRIIEAVDKFQKHNEISRIYSNQGAVWVIEDIGDDLEKHHLKPLSKPLDTCSKCKGRFSYKNDIDASNHLVHDHFEADRLPSAGEVRLWIKKYHPLCDKRQCEAHLRILKSCCNHLNVIHRGVQDIRNGVRTVGTGHNPRYRLPKALVEAFRKLVLLLVYTSHVLDEVTEHSSSWTHPDWKPRDDSDIMDEMLNLQSLGHTIEEIVDKGKLDLTLMIRTQDYTQSIRRDEAVGPQYILAMVLSNLQRGLNCSDLLDVYKEYIERLSFQVSQFPRRRLLRSLKYVHEEIESALNSMGEQNNILIDYLKVLNPHGFRTTTEARISLFDLELNLVQQGLKKQSQQRAEYLQLHDHVQRLIEATKTSVEINDDDHGKAILVFTIVTLVFLPMSFVTSFLGMNTVDIRNQTSTQSLFWIVALPITATVVVVALIIGYKYEGIREWAERSIGKRKRD